MEYFEPVYNDCSFIASLCDAILHIVINYCPSSATFIEPIKSQWKLKEILNHKQRSDILRRVGRYIRKVNGVAVKALFEYYEGQKLLKLNHGIGDKTGDTFMFLEVSKQVFEAHKGFHLGLSAMSFEQFHRVLYTLIGNRLNDRVTVDLFFDVLDSDCNGYLDYDDFNYLVKVSSSPPLDQITYKRFLMNVGILENDVVQKDEFRFLVESGLCRKLLMWTKN
ncbi:hypothetical protein ACOME3_004477 [Neoechinorhynchus agilis]